MDTGDPLVGRLLDGRYRLERLIARGGMATVYLGTDTRLDRTVAVKVLRAALAEDPEFVERFTREARSAARLSTPDVVAVFDQGRDPASGAAYLVMEHVRGRTLRDVLRERGPLPPVEALALLEPVLRALAAAHAAGLVHRDVKPENVLVADDGRVKVADFGLARAFQTSSLTSTSGVLLGTVAYLAPEQVEHGSADPRSDVYSAGIVLWELLTGTPPYESDTPLSVAFRHVHEDVPPPSEVVEGVPVAVDELVVRATRRDPAARPLDAGALLAEVRAVLADLPDEHRTVVVRLPSAGQPTLVVPRTPVRPARPVRRRRSRRKGVLWALVVLLLAAAALGGGWYLGTGRYADVPSVLGSEEAAAVSTLTAAGFEVRVDPEGRFDEQVPAGHVLEQQPDEGSRLRRGAVVTLVLSLGPDRRAVPEVAGSDVPGATAALEAVGLRAGTVVEEFSDRPVGEVLGTDPPAGELLREDTPVTLVVSKGLEMLPVPDVVGRSQADAGRALEAAGFTSGVREAFSDDVPKGQVIAQEPRAGGTAPRGSRVVVTVSKGPDLVEVPDVGGQPRDEAERRLREAGFEVRVIDVPAGPERVLRTDPGPGTQAKRGSTITVYTF
ncbi:MAG TPA: Stk1 family PASTA domain-containing Ser/Thr kinase [Mycobacteriales bacterium]|nr:Stk1 family PASTA domain-containing Ser/Thr kinase [Mycobacteriales bacterium]